MSRKFTPCTPAFLRTKLESLKGDGDPLIGSYSDINIEAFTKKIWEDLQKVSFDFENSASSPEHAFSNCETIVGFQVHDNGMPFFGAIAGGDWESPVFFIIYWDGKELRGYVPTDGNVWNTDNKSAYGNDDNDAANMKKRWPDDYGDQGELSAEDAPDCDPAKILADIAARIVSPEETHKKVLKVADIEKMPVVELTDREIKILSAMYVDAVNNELNVSECELGGAGATIEEHRALYAKLK